MFFSIHHFQQQRTGNVLLVLHHTGTPHVPDMHTCHMHAHVHKHPNVCTYAHTTHTLICMYHSHPARVHIRTHAIAMITHYHTRHLNVCARVVCTHSSTHMLAHRYITIHKGAHMTTHTCTCDIIPCLYTACAHAHTRTRLTCQMWLFRGGRQTYTNLLFVCFSVYQVFQSKLFDILKIQNVLLK